MPFPASAFFVYGTLKQHQLRGNFWPRPPIEIQAGIVQADLFDLGPYPAAVEGADWLLGELWRFHEDDLGVTLDVLDQIEGYDPSQVASPYVRKVVHVVTEASNETPAFMYFAGDMFRPDTCRKIPSFERRFDRNVASWPDAQARVPRSLDEE